MEKTGEANSWGAAHPQAPAVGDRVVQRERQQVVLRPQAQEQDAHQRPRRQRKWRVRIRQQRRQRARRQLCHQRRCAARIQILEMSVVRM